MVISGQNFGMTRSKSKVWLNKSPLSSSAVEFWSDSTIKIRIPPLSGSGLIYVETSGGRSRGTLYILSERLPDRSTGAFIPGKPYLSRINNSRFKPGELVILSGDKLGQRQKNSTILVNLSGKAPESVLDSPDESQYFTVPAENFSNWTDSSISFYLPEEARSGPVYVRTQAGYSNSVEIEVEPSGYIEKRSRRVLNISQSVKIDRVGALPGNSLVLWVPSPSPRPGQNVLKTESSLDPLRLDHNLQVYQLTELASGHEYSLDLNYKLSLSQLEYIIDKEDVPDHYDNLEMMEPFLRDEKDIFATYFKRTSMAVYKREKNPYAKASLLYDYVLWKMHPDSGNPEIDHTKWLTSRKTDSFGYASFFTSLCRGAGIPARIVSGVWISADIADVVTHYWSEIYLPGSGWFPVDTAAADGALSAYLAEEADPPGSWGSLDNGYLAFSRGLQRGFVFTEESKRIDFRSYSQQNIFEEWIGNLESCSIQWGNIAVIEE